MQTVTRTFDIRNAEAKYYDALHYVQVAASDPNASIADRKECLGYCDRAFAAWAKQIQLQHRRQHGYMPPIQEVRVALSEHVADVLNTRNSLSVRQEGR